ncbi:MAG TPA: serine O-acetyltransferase, partial [Burkholderiales bacterium]|nr:serine O-acetyltransferase [Burkholderiales bacterium]
MNSASPSKVNNLSTTQSETMWQAIRAEVTAMVKAEPALAGFLQRTVLHRQRFEDVLIAHLSAKLAGGALDEHVALDLMSEALSKDPDIVAAAMADLQAVRDRDPACETYAIPLLFFKGYQALQCYRVGHWLWRQGRIASAWMVQNRVSEVFAVEIHPAARIGRGILLDHATGFVVGETAVIDDHVSILHEVTLGGTGKAHGDRHPKIRRGVLISAGAKILGNIVVGEGAKVGAGSVVLHDVPPHCTVAGVPAKVVGVCESGDPASLMDH